MHIERYVEIRKGILKTEELETFRAAASKIVVNDKAFADTPLNYPRPCRGFCRTHTDGALLAFSDRVRDRVGRFVSDRCKQDGLTHATIGKAEFIMMFELVERQRRCIQFTGQLAFAAAVSGPNLAEQYFIEFRLVDPSFAASCTEDAPLRMVGCHFGAYVFRARRIHSQLCTGRRAFILVRCRGGREHVDLRHR